MILDEVTFLSRMQDLENNSVDSPQLLAFPSAGGMSASVLTRGLGSTAHIH